ncbi:hypothetical protein PBI_INGRID_49 [Arthrobacter phage Ingrid]|nr:hypothetical protein PBI_INGRID_49 [Arthrobacter phage Ingrid]QFG11031.1 hypothetical protein PBI_LORETTA_49 [Arthrobacter phage Loretta]
MFKTVVFAAGVVSGAIALPATLIYVKPVRTKIVDGVLNKAKHYFANQLVDDAEFRKDAIELCSELLVGLTLIDESKKEEGK